MRRRLLLLLPHSTYRAGPFVQAAYSIDAELVVASDHAPAVPNARFIELCFSRPLESLRTLVEAARSSGFDGVFGTDEASSYLAALAARALALKGNPPEAIAVLNDKLAFRRWLQTTDLRCPAYTEVSSVMPIPPTDGYPWVVKPRALSGSRGVSRVDNPEQYGSAARRALALTTKA